MGRAKQESSLSSYKPIDLNPKTPEPDQIESGSAEYLSGVSNALNNYTGGLQYFQIPCYISSVTEHQDAEVKPSYR